MFEDKRITVEKVKDLIHRVRNEFDNEGLVDFDYNRSLTDNDFTLISYYLMCFVNKLELVIDDELCNWKVN